jgi:signal transduction histidine kinase
MLKDANQTRKPLARQLMQRLGMAASLFALLTTLVTVYIEYVDESSSIEDVFTQIEEGYLGSVAEAVWLEDKDGLSLLSMGLSRLPHVVRIEVRDPDGALLASAGPPAPDELSRVLPLTRNYKDRQVAIGSLHVHATMAFIRQSALKTGLLFGLSNLVLVLAASVFLYFMVRNLIGIPLERLAVSARNLGQGQEESSFLADLEMRNLENEFGVLVRTLATMQTELQAAFSEIKSSEARYRELFTSAPIALWEEDFSAIRDRLDKLRNETDNLEDYLRTYPELVKECAGLVRIIDVNQAACRVHGAASRDELLGSVTKIFTPNSLFGFRKELLALWNGEHELAFESEVRTLAGDVREVVIHWLVLPSSHDRLDRVIVSQEDITDRVEARHSLALTVERLMQANSELERFTHAAAHDLAEPVRSIVSFSQLLERSLSNTYDKEIREYLGFLVAAAKRMQAQILGLQDYARVGEGVENRSMIDLSAAATRAIELLKEPMRLSQAEIDLHPLPRVYANFDQIADVLRNLLDNAIKFAKPGIPPSIRIAAERHGEEWIVSVTDNGIGIDPRYASDVFQIFRRLNPPSHTTGEGIGLSLCKRIIERHGGRMWVESSLGQGSAFHFALPASEGETSNVTAVAQSS